MSGESPSQLRIAIRRPVTMAMIFLALAVFGWKSYQELPINLMPDMSYPTLTVRTEFENAAPEDVEELVTRPLEEALSLVNGIVEVSSVSSAGLSEVILEFTWGIDMNEALQEVRESLDLVVLPQEITQQPVILRFDPTLDPIFRVAITGRDLSHIDDPDERIRLAQRDLTSIREDAERFVKSDLEAQTGIAQVLVRGGREEEIQVLADANRLKNIGLTLELLVNSIAQQNINLSGGSLKEGPTEYLVRTLNEFEDVDEIQEMVIAAPTGEMLKLKDVANVFMGEKERETIVRVNGREAVGLEIYKEGDSNTVDVCETLKDFFGFERPKSFTERIVGAVQIAAEQAGERRIERLGEEAAGTVYRRPVKPPPPADSRLPSYADLTLISDQSRFIVGAIKEVQQTALIGGVLALVILFFFLRELKSTIIVGIAIPISIIATFVPMFVRDISLNLMSLGGLALGVGMLVDNSIVVLESIFRCKEEGDDVVTAADRGTREVAGAVTASTLTTIAVFFPIVFVEGVAGQVFGDLALTVTFSLLASLLVAVYLIPMVASRVRPEFKSTETSIWIVNVYNRARARNGSLSLLPGHLAAEAAVASKAWLAFTWNDTISPALKTARGEASTADDASPGAAAKWGAVLLLPVVFTLFLLHCIVKLAGSIFVAFAFFMLILPGLFIWLTGRLLRIVLWLPMRVFDTVFNGMRNLYVIVLRFSLHFSPVILLLTAALAVHAGWTALGLGRELIPPLKQGEFGIRMEAPPGTPLEETELQARAIERIVMNDPDVDTVTMEVGSEKLQSRNDRGENVAELNVRLKNPEVNAQYQDEIIEVLRGQVHQVTPNEATFTLPRLFSFKSAVELQIRGDDLDVLAELGRTTVAKVRAISGVEDVEMNLKKGFPEVTIEFDRRNLASRNIAPLPVAQAVRREVEGEVSSYLNRKGGDRIDIRVRTGQEHLSSVSDLMAMSVTDSSPPIPLQSVAKIVVKEGPSEVRRVDQRRVVAITANVVGRDLGAVSDDILAAVETIHRPNEYHFVLAGQNRELQTSYAGLQFALVLAIFLVYVVMACQFESIWHPALIMFSVPLAFIGVVYVLDWFNISLSIVVFMGGIVLAGIVVNDAIVLVDYVNQLRRRGMSKREAVVAAGQVRFRPIIMTTLTTVLGLMPMAIWAGDGAEMRQPMAVTVMAGLTSATVLTLVILPLIYDFVGGREKT